MLWCAGLVGGLEGGLKVAADMRREEPVTTSAFFSICTELANRSTHFGPRLIDLHRGDDVSPSECRPR